MEIRAASGGDAGAVTALWTQGYSGRHPEGRQAPYTEEEFFDALAGGRVSLAVEDGAVLGVVVFNDPASPRRAVAQSGEAELSRLVVDEGARRRGVGRALTSRCVEQARLAGATAIALWSRPYQSEAHRLYESVGFRRAPERDRDDVEGRRLVFVLDLAAPG